MVGFTRIFGVQCSVRSRSIAPDATRGKWTLGLSAEVGVSPDGATATNYMTGLPCAGTGPLVGAMRWR